MGISRDNQRILNNLVNEQTKYIKEHLGFLRVTMAYIVERVNRHSYGPEFLETEIADTVKIKFETEVYEDRTVVRLDYPLKTVEHGNTCLKCNVYNEYVEKINNYVCRSCKSYEQM